VTVAGGYADIVLMGAGTDTLKVRWGSDFGYGTEGWTGNMTTGYSATYTAYRTDQNEVRFTGVEKFDVVTGQGSDTIRTGDGDDILAGNGGNDTFRTGKGADNVAGGDGADRWQANKSNATAAVAIDLTAASSTYEIGGITSTVTGIEALGGSDADGDRFMTGAQGDILVTRSDFHADYVDTRSGDDTVTVAGGYADIVLMGDGTDTLKVRWAGGAFGFGTAGWTGTMATGYSGTYTAFRTDQNEVRFAGVEKFDIILGEGSDDIRTGDGDDIVVGNGGNDTFRTGKGVDNVNGGAGADRWQADKSNATAAMRINLTAASSTYAIGTATATVSGVEALGGSDAIGDRFTSGSGNDVLVTRSDFYADYIETNSGNDSVTVAGGYADIVLMGAGTDTLKVRWTGGAFGFGTTNWDGNAVDGFSGTYTAFRTDQNEVRFTGVEKFDLVLGEGSDDIRTGDGDDSVVGNGGNDTFRTGKGADKVNGGAGADRWQADKSNATAAIKINLAAAGPSTYRIGAVTVTVSGIEALGGSDAIGDRFATGSNNDALVTRSDFYADYIETNGGDDTVTVAGGYADIVLMGAGTDTLRVRWASSDFGFGTSGWTGSLATGYSATYTAFRTDQNEVRFTGVEKFDLVLGQGSDDIRTGDGDDIVVGNGGNDTFRTGKGADNVDGGAGADRWQADKSNATAAIRIDLTAASSTYRIGAVTATVSGIEALGGSDADGDRFATGSNNDALVTRSDFHADYIETNGGDDAVTVAGGYADIVLMGAGTDTLKVRWAGSDFGFGTAGWTGSLATGYSATYTAFRTDQNEVRFSGVEKFDLVLGQGSDDIVTGDGDDLISGQNGDDRLSGAGGNDQMWGDAGNDTLLGGAGNDQLDGGVGADTLDGGQGDDTYFVDATDTVRDTGAGGNDQVFASLSYALATGSGIETLSTKANATQHVSLTGDEAGNTVFGNGGNNILMGLDGDDQLFGAGGNDRLLGGLGRDTLTGGAGIDTYAFDASDSTVAQFDNIADFVTGTDKIDLSTVPSPGLAASAFTAVAVASNNFATLFNAASAAMSAGDKSAVFVAGSIHGWLFWNTDAAPETPDSALRLNGLNTLASFQRTDIV